MTHTTKCDVLVIGAGGAALRAALEAHDNGAHVILVTKGTFGESGATAYRGATSPGGFNFPDGDADPSDNLDVYFQDIIDAGLGMCDERLVRVLVEETVPSLRYLESHGVKFERNAQGKYVAFQGCFSSRPRSHVMRPHALPLVAELKRCIKELRIPVYESTTMADLVVENNVCGGAIGIDERGNLLVIQAKSTILASGGGSQIFLESFYPSDATGDGYAMAWRAGAELANLEFMQAGVGVPSGGFLIPAWFWLLQPELYNRAGESFIERYLPEGTTKKQVFEKKGTHWPFSTRDCSRSIEIAIQKECSHRKGSSSTGVMLDFRNVDEARLELMPEGPTFKEMWRKDQEVFRSRGVDLSKEVLKVSCFGHSFSGGLVTDTHAQSSVEGLYAAGEVAAGPHGADRLGGNMLVTCQVFGARAGRHAAGRARRVDAASVRSSAIEKATERVERTRRAKGDLEPARIAHDLKRTMSKNALVVRTKTGLEEGLREVRRIQDAFGSGVAANTNSQLVKALEVQNMLEVAALLLRSALSREESRGNHYREDFPTRDDERWGRSIVTKCVDGKPQRDTRSLSAS
jgi:succinate dehydrogenase/fumarate reductase flavoprotein subunit